MLGKKGLKAEAPNESIPYDADDDAQDLVNGGIMQDEPVPEDTEPEQPEMADDSPVNALVKLRKGIVKIR